MDFSKKAWDKPDDFISLYKTLHELSDEKYREFNSRIVKGNMPMLGIRMPLLKKIAHQIAKSNFQAFLDDMSNEYYECVMLRGLVISYAPLPYETFLKNCDEFIDLIENWAVCDGFCSAIRLAEHHEEFFAYLTKYLKSENPWHIRVGLVLMLNKYIDDTHIGEVLARCDSVKSEHYYVKMAQAWLVSIAYMKEKDVTLSYLKHNTLDHWTFNKAISKMRDSYRVSAEDKAMLNTLKRK